MSMGLDAPAAAATSALNAAEANKTPAINGDMKRPEMRRAAEKLEAHFLGSMFKHMFEGTQPKPPFGGGHAEKMFQDLMVDQYAKKVADQGGIGLADSVVRQMLEQQEA